MTPVKIAHTMTLSMTNYGEVTINELPVSRVKIRMVKL